MSENYWDKLMEDDEHAASYMTTYGEGPGAETRHQLGKYLESEDWVLDVGCGPGHNFEHFQQYGPSVYYRGIDYSERFVRVASERVKPMKIFEKGDARHLTQADGSFDVVLLQDILEHTNGFEKPTREALRVARKRVVVAFWHLVDMDDPHINDDGNDGWGAWYDKREWEAFLDTLKYKWTHEIIQCNNRDRDFYVIEKRRK